MKTVGDRIREKREELGLTQDELSKKLGYKSRSSVNKMENARELPLKKVKMMADVLGCSPAYLMGWDSKELENTKTLSSIENHVNKLLTGTNAIKIDKNDLNSINIVLIDEPAVHIHSAAACEIAKMMKTMSEDDLKFLADTARRIMPKENNTDNIIPFSQYPTVTNKDIDEFAARNAKKKFSREEIAEIIYEMRKDD